MMNHTRYMGLHTIPHDTACALCGGFMHAGAKAVLSFMPRPFAHRCCAERRMSETANDWIAR